MWTAARTSLLISVTLLGPGGCDLPVPYEANCETRTAYYPDENGDGLGEATAMFLGCSDDDAPDGWVTALDPRSFSSPIYTGGTGVASDTGDTATHTGGTGSTTTDTAAGTSTADTASSQLSTADTSTGTDTHTPDTGVSTGDTAHDGGTGNVQTTGDTGI